MTRLSPYVLVSLLVPAIAAAQAIPVPPAPPSPVAAPVAPRAPRPATGQPLPPTPPLPKLPTGDDFKFDIDTPMAINLDELRLQIDSMQPFIADRIAKAEQQLMSLRDQNGELSRQAADQARQAIEQARQEVDRTRVERGPQPFTFSQDSPAGSAYRGGLDALQQRQYDRAIASFDRVIGMKGDRADAALYWKAFAQFKLARTDDSLTSITQLRKDYPQSRYLNEAKVLEADARKASGQPVNPASANDDEIKLLAIQGLSKSDQAVPLLEGVLHATNSLNVKKRALYVLALSDDARAHQVLMQYAKGGGNPDLQVEAIRYLASRKDSKTTPTELLDIYNSSSDVNVKLAVIDAYRTWGDKVALVKISGDRTAVVDVRRSAMSRLSGLADVQDIMGLYQQEPDANLRLQLVTVLGSMNATDQLVTVAKTDKDQNVRIRAIRSLGTTRRAGPDSAADRTPQLLLSLYSADQDKEVRRAVIQSLMTQNNAEALISLARKETDPDLRRTLVSRISDMVPNSKAAADYLMEQLK